MDKAYSHDSYLHKHRSFCFRDNNDTVSNDKWADKITNERANGFRRKKEIEIEDLSWSPVDCPAGCDWLLLTALKIYIISIYIS